MTHCLASLFNYIQVERTRRRSRCSASKGNDLKPSCDDIILDMGIQSKATDGDPLPTQIEAYTNYDKSFSAPDLLNIMTR